MPRRDISKTMWGTGWAQLRPTGHCCLAWLDFLLPVFDLLWPIADFCRLCLLSFACVRLILASAPSGPSAFSVLTASNRPQACSSLSPLLRAWTRHSPRSTSGNRSVPAGHHQTQSGAGRNQAEFAPSAATGVPPMGDSGPHSRRFFPGEDLQS